MLELREQEREVSLLFSWQVHGGTCSNIVVSRSTVPPGAWMLRRSS